MTDWLQVKRGDAPLIVSFPHTGTDIPAEIESGLVSPWLARQDADWWIHRLYDLAEGLGATMVRTAISRTVIDVNRDPSGASLYPGQATTELCPTTTFDGEPLYKPGQAPDAAEIARRRDTWFTPYHDALAAEAARLRGLHGKIVVYDAHSIRSKVPRLFDGDLPNFNIGDNGGRTCDPALRAAVEAACDVEGFSRVTNGRFKGGWTTRHYGRPADGVHAIQMELAIRSYMDEPQAFRPENWPTAYDETRAGAVRAVLSNVLTRAIAFATN
ncbi:N-formylglutamate deformylase [Caulobacter sp. 73W]|uniref:N-formylglutamate deformylase n=1 Tax=Caulobacter sp. 73W TaxID=3161137 RepID=A0AB39KQB0_9CAUL